ncbi:MAG: DUF2207 domain-containing protein [Aminivibrio sp.]|jgi:hypothetical protein
MGNGVKKMRRAFYLPALLVVAFILCLGASPLSANERITSFDVEAEINADASLTVRERITVVAEGREIKRGIIRSIPTDFTDTEGVKRRAPMALLSAELDGEPAMVDTERSGANLNFRLGNPDVLLTRGEHVFDIVYRTEGQLGFFADHDELYWNATGNEWTFIIEKASFRAKLPGKDFGEGFTAIEFYTGRPGERGKAAKVLADGTVTSTYPFTPGKGLTVVFSWPRGVIMHPKEPAPRAGGPAGLLLPFIFPTMTLLLTALMSALWWKWGRDPAPMPVYPLFEPPEGVEAGFARYVRNMRSDDRAFTAMILGMAVKGILAIEDTNASDEMSSMLDKNSAAGKALKFLARFAGPSFKLKLNRNRLKEVGATPAETRLVRDLFGFTRKEIFLSSADRPVIQEAYENLSDNFKAMGKPFFSTNLGKWIAGVALFEITSIAAFFMMAMADRYGAEPFIAFFAGPFLLMPLTVPIDSGRKARVKRFLFRVLIPGAFLLLTLFLAYWSYLEGMNFGFWSVLSIFAAIAVLTVFRKLLPVRSEQGARLNEQIEGLLMYITAAEKHRFEMAPPEETPRLFEKLFPYAYALDAAETWADRFQSVLEEAGYSPSWYTGDLSTFTTGAGVAAFSSAISGAVSSGTRSSGSGGGGSSGGGGGGGGGSGW